MDLSILKHNVEQGADLLDSYNAEWPMLVNLDTLDVANPWACVLAQVFNEDWQEKSHYATPWMHGLEVLGLSNSYIDSLNHGFDVDNSDAFVANGLWIKAITERV